MHLPLNPGKSHSVWTQSGSSFFPKGTELDVNLTESLSMGRAQRSIHPDCQPPAAQPSRPDMGSGLCGQPQARSPDILQQRQPNSFHSVAAICVLPSLGSPLHSPQDQRCPGRILDLSRLRVEPTRLHAQTSASLEDQPLQLSLRAPEQAAHGGQLDS